MKKRFAVFIPVIILLCVLTGCSRDATDESSFEIMTVGNGVIITAYTGSATKVVVPEYISAKPVTSVSYMSFYGNENIVSIDLPDSLMEIGDYAFAKCAALESVRFGNKLTKIGKGAFLECSSLEKIALPDMLSELSDESFSGCEALEKITLGSSLKTVPAKTFFGCVRLKSASLPSTVTEIGESAFRNCTKLDSVQIGNGTSSIAQDAFKGCGKKLRIITSADSYAAEYAELHGFSYSKY